MLLAADDTVPWFLGLLLSVAMIAAAVLMIAVNNGASSGRIGPNPGVGIRTAATRSSPEAWRAAHQAAKPWLQFASMIALVVGVALLALRSSAAAFYGVLLVGVFLLALLAIIGSIAADRAAKAVRDGG